MTLDEKVFRKMEFEDCIKPAGYAGEWPPISSDWNVTAKYLVPFMGERGFKYQFDIWNLKDKEKYIFWTDGTGVQGSRNKEIKDDNIALAACEAFMEVEL